MKLSPDAITSLLTSLFPSGMIDDLAREREVVVRERKLDVRVLIWTLIIMAAISLLMSRVIFDELQKLDQKQRDAEAAADADPSASRLLRRRCSLAVERHAHLIQLYLMMELGHKLPDLDESLLWVARNPNPHRERLREQVERGGFVFAPD
jgi:putative transposase